MLVGPDDMKAAFKRKKELLKSSGNMYWVRDFFFLEMEHWDQH